LTGPGPTNESDSMKKKYMIAVTLIAMSFVALVACERNTPNLPKPVVLSTY
jgi:hypothetical protein